MKKRTCAVLSAVMIILCLITFTACGKTEPDSPVPQGGDKKPEYDYDKDYPGTAADFTYDSLYNGNLPAEGNVTVMVIPLIWDDGADIDEDFLSAIDDVFYKGNEGWTFGVKEYFENASYGRLHVGYELMPSCSMGVNIGEWNYYEYPYPYIYAYKTSLSSYAGDLSRFDSDGDGFADAVLFVNNADNSRHMSFACELTVDQRLEASDAPLPLCRYADCYYSDFVMSDSCHYMAVHELAHLFGINDYYDLNGCWSYISRFSLHEGGYGDMNSFSKYAVGWIEPYVITGDVEKVTLKLRCSAEYPDAILIPSSAGWNGTPFDEYLLIDVFAGKGNNEDPWRVYVYEDTSNTGGGVRIMHVDAGYEYYDIYSGRSYGPLDPQDYDPGEWRDVRSEYSNYSGDDWSADQYADYHLLELIPFEGEVTMDYSFNTDMLFGEGAVFTMEDYSGYFTNGTMLDNGGTIPYRITVDHYDPETAEAIVTVERIE